MFLRLLLKRASPGGDGGRLSVLVLHRVVQNADPLYPEAMVAKRFSEMCGWVASMFNVLALDVAVNCLRNGTLPERALAITFDDGYADNRHVAMPILQSLGLPATVFITTGFLNGGCMWNDIIVESCRRTRRHRIELRDLLPQAAFNSIELATLSQRRRGLEMLIAAVKYFEPTRRLATVEQIAERLDVAVPKDLMMSSDDVVALRRGGLQVGAHTVSHPILAKLSPAEMRHEMKGSKDFLEQLLREPVTMFAYPNGKPGEDYNSHSVALARELGFESAVTTARGAASSSTDLFQIPRFTPWDRSRLKFGARMWTTLVAPVATMSAT